VTNEERIFTQPLALRVNGSLSGKTSRRVKALQLAASVRSVARSIIISRLCCCRDSSDLPFPRSLIIVALLKIFLLSQNHRLSFFFPSFLLFPRKSAIKKNIVELFSRTTIYVRDDKSARRSRNARILPVPFAGNFVRACRSCRVKG
jgi:hypothetical protein